MLHVILLGFWSKPLFYKIFFEEILFYLQVDNGGYCPHHHADVHWAGGVMQEGDVQEGSSCAGLRREVWNQYMYCKICTVLTL